MKTGNLLQAVIAGLIAALLNGIVHLGASIRSAVPTSFSAKFDQKVINAVVGTVAAVLFVCVPPLIIYLIWRAIRAVLLIAIISGTAVLGYCLIVD